MKSCVNVKSRAFQQMAKDLNVSDAQLELLAHQYNMIKARETGAENASAFLTDSGKEWINSQLQGIPMQAGENVVKLWEEKYSKPQVFDNRSEATEAFLEAEDIFFKGAVLKETNDGKYELTVAKPYTSMEHRSAVEQALGIVDRAEKAYMSATTDKEVKAVEAKFNKYLNEVLSPEVKVSFGRYGLMYGGNTRNLELLRDVADLERPASREELYDLFKMLSSKFNKPFRVHSGNGLRVIDRGDYFEVTTNPSRLPSYTQLAEEMLHPLVENIQRGNPELFNQFLQEVRNTKDRKLKVIRDGIYRSYSNESIWVQNNELVTQALAYELKNSKAEKSSVFKKLVDALVNWLVEHGLFTQAPKDLTLKHLAYALKFSNIRFNLANMVGTYEHREVTNPVDSVQEREAQVRKFLEDQQRFYNEIKAIQESGRLSSVEVRKVAADVAYAVSDLITQIQNGEVDINELVPGKTTKKDIKDMSRAEILAFIGVYTPKTDGAEDSGAFAYVRRKYFGNLSTIKGEGEELRANRRAAVTINNNFRAIVELAAEEFVNVEGFGLRVVDGRPAEIVESLNINIDDVNGDMDANEVLEREGNLQEHWQVNFRTIDVLGSMSQIVRQALLQCYKLDRAGNPIESRFGIKERVTAREATSQILRWTQGAIDMQTMIEKLREHEDSSPWIRQIISRLERGEKTDAEYGADTDFRSQFYNVFNKHFQLYTSIIENNDGKYFSAPSNEHPALKDIMTQLQAFVATDQVPMFQGGRVDAGVLAQFRANVDRIPGLTEQQFNELTPEQIEDAQDMIWLVMKELGTIITADQIADSWNYKNYKAIKSALFHIGDTLSKHLNDEVYDPFEFRTGIKGNLMTAIGALIDNLEDVAVSSFYDNGKTYQSYVTPSYLTKFMQKMRLQGEAFETFIQEEFGQYDWFKMGDEWRNPWIKAIVELGDRGFKCGTIPYRELLAHKVELNFDKHGYMREMSPAEYSLSLIAEFFSATGEGKEAIVPAWYRVPILSNKPSSEFIRFTRYADPNTYKENIINDLMSVFAQELSRIKTTKARNEVYGKNSPEFIKNLDKNGRRFNFLPYLNTTGNAEFADLVARKTDPHAEALSVEEEATLNQLARREIEKYLSKRASDIIAKWEQNGVMKAATKIQGINANNVRTQLENFIWNDHLATIMIEELFVTDIALYKNTEDLQKRMAQIHAPGVRGDVTAVDYDGKRVSADGKYRTVLLTDFDGFKSNVIDNIREVFKRREQGLQGAELAAAQSLHNSIVEQYEKINVADAQGYSCITSRRKKDFIMGLWSREKEAMYQRIISNNYSDADLAALFDIANACEPEKPFCYSQIKKSTNVPQGMSNYKLGVQYKNSEYLLIMADAILQKEKLSRPNLLRAINTFMEESAKHFDGRGIDTVQFESASKALTQGRVNIFQYANVPGGEQLALLELQKAAYTDENFSAYNLSVVHEVPFEDWCIQQPVPNHFYDHAQAQGSQGRMIIPSDLATTYSGEEVLFDVYGESFNAQQFREEYESISAANIEQSLEELKEELGLNTSDRKARNVAIAEILQREIKSSPRYGTDLLRACTLNSDGEFMIPLSDPIQSKRIEQLLNSIIKNRVNKQEIAGGPVVQVSNFGTSQDLNIRYQAKSGGLLDTKAEYASKNGLTGKALDKAYAEYCAKEQGGIAYYEVYVSRFEGIEKYEDKFGKDMARIERECPEMLDLIAYRIPTEDKYSITPCKIKGFLPRFAGAGIMMPADITTQTGSDFDIDKMYVMRKQFVKDEKGNYVFPHDKETTIGRNNRIVEMYRAVLTHESNADKILNPGGFEPQRRTGYMVQAFKTNPDLTWERLQEIADGASIEIDGEPLSGIDALKALSYKSSDLGFVDTQIQFYEQNSAASSILAIFAVAKVAHATLENNRFRVLLNGTGPDGVGMRYPIQISNSTIGAEMDMTAEIDPTFNIDGDYIGKSLGCLVASAADAVKDPVLNLMNINKETVNILNTLIRLGVPFEKATLLLSQKVVTDTIQEYYKTRLIKGSTLSEVISERLKKFKEMGDAEKVVLTDEDLVKGLRDDSDVVRTFQTLFTVDKVMRIHNAISGMNFLTRFNSIANAVGPLIIDNKMKEDKKVESSFSQIMEVTQDGKYKQGEILNAVFAKHPILKQFSLTLDVAHELFADMPEYNNSFTAALTFGAKGFGEVIMRNREVLNKYADFFKSYMLVVSGVVDASELEYYVNGFAKDFMKIKKGEKYSSNPFIQAIKVAKDKSGSLYLKVDSSVLNDQTYKGDLSASWADLLKQDQELAIKLFKYCFFRGGIGFTPRTFMQLVPIELKEAIPGYVDTYRTSTVQNFPERTFARTFAQNNWRDNRIAPEVVLYNKKGELMAIPHSEDILEVPASFSRSPYMKAKGSDSVYHLYELHYMSTEARSLYQEIPILGGIGEYLEFAIGDNYHPIEKKATVMNNNTTVEENEEKNASWDSTSGEDFASMDQEAAEFVSEFTNKLEAEQGRVLEGLEKLGIAPTVESSVNSAAFEAVASKVPSISKEEVDKVKEDKNIC